MWIIGLGNPEKQYAKTRHNIGWMFVDSVQSIKAGNFSPWTENKKFRAEMSAGILNGQPITLVKPLTFMNESGVSVASICHFYKIEPKDILVAHDDKDLLLGDVRLESNRNHAGHNGVRSIIDHLKTKDFPRLRLGIATDKLKTQGTVNFVLGKFGIFERGAVKAMLEKGKALVIK